ncbi:MAG: hypothetical protein A2293_17110 [Elusimicrobia bacterium RIFOXYB2_FULL_49_7]|nr:MAG: hypothetical protein A2293_17110 [Elusimicrobia bacterium RIFOXYB2_FULL_49_7]
MCALLAGLVAAPQLMAQDETGAQEPQVCDDVAAEEGPLASEDEIGEEDTLENDKVGREAEETEKLYRKAVLTYEQGDKETAARLYKEVLLSLQGELFNVDAFYRMRAGFEDIFYSLRTLPQAPAAASGVGASHYRIPIDAENDLVKKYLKIYTTGGSKANVKKALERSGRYREMILRILKEYDLPEELVYLPVVESLYSNNDLSWAGALGLWQLMPARARHQGLKMNYWIDERKDPEKATRAAARYLKDLYLMFDNWHLALAAYNRGEYGLARDLQFSKATNITQMSERNAVPRETENFVPQFITSTLIGDNPEKYGFDIQYEQPLRYDEVTVNAVIDLAVIAKCAGADLATIRELNPALKAWCTPHSYPDFTLKIPAGTKAAFQTNLAQVKELNPTQGYIKYRVVKGDCLSKIAKKFNTTVGSIKEDNRLAKQKFLRVGQTLMIRPGRKYFAGKEKRG